MIPVKHLPLGEFVVRDDLISVVMVSAVTPLDEDRVRVDFADGTTITYPALSEVLIRAAAVQ